MIQILSTSNKKLKETNTPIMAPICVCKRVIYATRLRNTDRCLIVGKRVASVNAIILNSPKNHNDIAEQLNKSRQGKSHLGINHDKSKVESFRDDENPGVVSFAWDIYISSIDGKAIDDNDDMEIFSDENVNTDIIALIKYVQTRAQRVCSHLSNIMPP